MKTTVKQVALLFLNLGITAFGGPAAHIAMMRHEVVKKRAWMDDRQFLKLLGAVNLIPGPNSTEMALHIGHKKAGWKGLVTAGLVFILPAVAITGCFAWLYKAYGSLPEVAPLLYGIGPAVIAIIGFAVWPLARASVKNNRLVLLGVACLALSLYGLHEALVIFLPAMCYAALLYRGRQLGAFFPIALAWIGNTDLFLKFLKIGAILYGSGYALFAYIDTELVATGTITRQQLADAIAVGQFTPGPVFSSVTFIGYQANGLWGAVAATAGVFLPSFIFVALLGRILHLVERSAFFSAFLDAANVASVAVIVSVCLRMGVATLNTWHAVAILAGSAVLLWSFPKLNSAWLVLFGSAAGFLLSLL